LKLEAHPPNASPIGVFARLSGLVWLYDTRSVRGHSIHPLCLLPESLRVPGTPPFSRRGPVLRRARRRRCPRTGSTLCATPTSWRSRPCRNPARPGSRRASGRRAQDKRRTSISAPETLILLKHCRFAFLRPPAKRTLFARAACSAPEEWRFSFLAQRPRARGADCAPRAPARRRRSGRRRRSPRALPAGSCATPRAPRRRQAIQTGPPRGLTNNEKSLFALHTAPAGAG
jgi:hypothetical protein